MGRAKLKMELIEKEKTRLATYHKRKLGILKKAKEFTILCDVDTIMIIIPPNSNEPEAWPENNPAQIKKGIASYKSRKGGRKTYTLNDFFEERKKKVEDDLMKARKKNMEAKYSTWFDELNILPEHQLRQFVDTLVSKENEAKARLELMKRSININYPYMHHFGNTPTMIHFPGLGLGNPNPQLDDVQLMKPRQVMNHWFGNDTPSTSYMPVKHEPVAPYGYRGLVYDNNLNTLLSIQRPHLLQGGVLSEFVPQELESQVNNGGAGDYAIDYCRGRIME